MKELIIFTLVIILGGCQSTADKPNVTETLKCSGENWHAIGVEAALASKNVRYFDKYIDTCGDRLESDAKSSYVRGYTEGVSAYCTYETGFELGKKNVKVIVDCPIEKKERFLLGYKRGKSLLRETVRKIEQQQESQYLTNTQEVLGGTSGPTQIPQK